ncbi:hypothetical protein B0F90DRAFT_1818490 [Multifurca ochricompacta]|uniref:Uncharacterized protein n=1 Tax=Multifurca ochricompacta TaxID=376703 RepID=A0AAD4M1P8_9AGAM|nr:hypothetical protein B0F90DRAFT_1818490 [Multifurca ochricompacta]
MSTLSSSLRNANTVYSSSSSNPLYYDSSRPISGAPLNPRDHSLLEYIYTEMHAARFINLSPLSLLANSLPVYFKNVRSHAPIMFMFPPQDLSQVKLQLLRSTRETGDSEDALGSTTKPHHRDSVKSGPATLIGSRQILHHTQQYVVLDESAVAPGTVKARQKVSTSSLHLPGATGNVGTPTQNNFPSTSSLGPYEPSFWSEEHLTSTTPTAYSHTAAEDFDSPSWLNTLPNQRLKFDLQSLNLHLSTRVTEILACSEAMWEWVCEYQDAQRSNRGPAQAYKEHSQLRFEHLGGKVGADRFCTELIGMSRAEFDVLLTRFEFDTRDCINMKSRITSAFRAPAPALARTSDRKAFDKACEKWEEYQIKQRARPKTNKNGDPSAAESEDGEAAGLARQRLSRTFRVFCAWKAS